MDSPAEGPTRSASEHRLIEPPGEDRFPPGTVLEHRYRVSGRLGHGGMGDVYKAYDLTLSQDVALKFLPHGFVATPAARDRLRQEVRLARQVSHPNVCRVYDIGEAAGSPFLSMEYVDGEDLASLLRRIGRLPSDKALDIARKLCAGLSAAHEKHVLHRDLKPANIMVDGRGEVLITDFGLAAVAGTVSAERTREGTRPYMSPEQLAGSEVTARSDIYALGLVLYEVFTGKRAFQSGSEGQLARLQRESTPTSMAAIAKDIEPAVERTILRCLAHDPRERPASAKLVALALPGGDPLAAAIAAGETPSPEMVARAGDTQGLHPAVATSLLAGVVLGLVLMAGWQPGDVLTKTPFDNSPEALVTMAREHIGRLGYGGRPVDSAYGLYSSDRYFRYAASHYSSDRIWTHIAAARPAPFIFWYRQSPVPLSPDIDNEQVTTTSPALDRSGMLRLSTDLEGRLLSFEAIPAEHEASSDPSPSTDWNALFAAAGLDASKLQPVPPEWTPRMAFDSRMAWSGAWPEAPEVPIRLEAASWRGTLVSFRIIEPWTTTEPDQPTNAALLVICVVLAPIACFLAWRNVKRRRADQAGALRLAVAVFLLDLTMDLLVMSHVVGPSEFSLVFRYFASDIVEAAFVAVLYLALEPYVRQRCPRLLVSWTRLLQGGWRDPLVGTHLLIGSVAGIAVVLISRLVTWLPLSRGAAPQVTFLPNGMLGTRILAGNLIGGIYLELFFAMGFLFLFFVLLLLLRRDWLAAIGWVVVLAALVYRSEPGNSIGYGLVVAGLAIRITILLRFGFLANLAMNLPYLAIEAVPLTLNPTRWYFPYSLAALIFTAAIAVYAFRISLGRRSLFDDYAVARSTP